MENILGVGGITISDLNDAIISGDAPRNPDEGALWIDSSAKTPVLKVYKNGSWQPQEIDVNNLDPELSDTVSTIVNTLGTLANDGLLTYSDRLQLSVEIASIIGEIPSKQNGNVYPNTLPAYNVIDSLGVGSFSSLRQTARDATVPTDNEYYIALEQAYTSLNTYLSSLTPRPWDVTLTNKDTNTEVANPDTYREALLNYYLAEMNLATYTEKRASDASKEYTDASVQDAITSVDVEYATSTDSKTVPNDDEWDTLAPAWDNGIFIWSRTLTTYKNGSTFISDPVNITGAKGESGGPGAAGRSITKIQEQYYVSDSATEQIGGKWENEYPGWEEGKFIWTRSVITFTNPSGTHTTDPISVSGAKGDKGDPGVDAPTIKLSGASQMIKQDALGDVTPSESFNVIGVAVNTTITKWSYSVNGGAFGTGLTTGVTRSGNVVTINPKDVTFNTLSVRAEDGTVTDTFTIGRAVDGDKGETGSTGGKGTDGKDGADAITVLLSNESHTFQAGTSNAIAGSTTTDIHAYKGTNRVAVTVGTITGMPEGMTSSISNNGKVNARVTFTVATKMTRPSGVVTIPITVDGKIINKEFSYALTFKGVDGENGEDGVSITLVDVEYARNNSPEAAPTSGWDTKTPTWINGYYIWSRTKTTYSTGSPTYSTPACITGQKGSEGNDGRGIKDITEQFYLSTSKTSTQGGEWVLTPPAWVKDRYMWTRSEIEWTNPTDTTWTDPVVDTAWEKLDNIESRVHDAEQLITDDAIISTVTESTTYKDDRSRSTIISTINQTAEAVSIDASNINLTGKVTISSFGTDVTNKLDNIESDVSTAQSDADTAKANASTAQTTATDAQTRVEDVEGKIDNAVTTIDGTGVTVKDGSFFLEDDQTDTKYSIVPSANLIQDHSFELMDMKFEKQGSLFLPAFDSHGYNIADANIDPIAGWAVTGSPRLYPGLGGNLSQHPRMFGRTASVVNSANYVYQNISLPVEVDHDDDSAYTYTLSAYFRVVPHSTSAIPRFNIRTGLFLENKWGDWSTKNFSSVEYESGMVRFSHTFNVMDLYKSAGLIAGGDLQIRIQTTNSNWIMVDGVQLVLGKNPTHYNSEETLFNFLNGLNGASGKALQTESIRSGVVDAELLRVNGFNITEENAVASVGSNSNGNWIKFHNGVQICYGKLNHNFYTTISKYHDLPIAFANADYSTAIGAGGGDWREIETISAVGIGASTNSRIRMHRFNSTAHRKADYGDIPVTYIAIGRWKS